VELIELGPFHPEYDGGRVAAGLVRASGASATIAFNDLMALGLVAEYAAHGIRVGKDASVVGIDDIWLAGTAVRPTLTTVRIPAAEAGIAAVNSLAEAIAYGSIGSPTRIELPTALIIRETTGPRRDEAGPASGRDT